MAQQTPSVTKRMLTHWLASNLDGFRDRCAVKIGRRVLLDREAVEAWIEAHRGKTEAEAHS
jgi:ribosomal protein L34